MCGLIAVSKRAGVQADIREALDSIHHRGPDGKGLYVSDHRDCVLGHVRLAIIDLSDAGHQPMLDSTGRYVIAFNGEIYNFKLLKEQIQSQYGFSDWRSGTDTEVILEGFSKEGPSFFGKLNGIFSISLYDQESKKLYCVRDPIGIKPLYYTCQNGCVYFSSEVKGLLKIPGLAFSIRRQSVLDSISFMYVPEPFTMYNEVEKLGPGMCRVFSQGQFESEFSIAAVESDECSSAREEDLVELFRDKLSAAVRSQVVADVPVSLFLSGGLDSSAVAYEAVGCGANVSDAYTISFSKYDTRYDQQSDDLAYAKLMASRLGISLEVIEAEKNLISLLPELVYYMEDGISDPAAINTFLICKGARESGVKVMLSGQGADEYLCGYRRYIANRIYSALPDFLSPLFNQVDRAIPASVPGALNGFFRRLKKFAGSIGLSPDDRFLSMYLWNKPEILRELVVDGDSLSVGSQHLSRFFRYKGLGATDAMMKVDQLYDLISLNLSYTDKMSMMVGVEARVPFLDLELVRFVESIPVSLKLRGLTQKYLLKKSMEGRLPKDIIYRPKAGFALPIRSWLKDENELIGHYLSKSELDRKGVFCAESTSRMLDRHLAGGEDHSYSIFAMLAMQIWLNQPCNVGLSIQ